MPMTALHLCLAALVSTAAARFDLKHLEEEAPLKPPVDRIALARLQPPALLVNVERLKLQQQAGRGVKGKVEDGHVLFLYTPDRATRSGWVQIEFSGDQDHLAPIPFYDCALTPVVQG